MVDQWPLVGRAEELRVISDALIDPTHRGMVIAGPAGVGKTRLSRAAADAAKQTGWSVRHIAGTSSGRPILLGAFARWADTADGAPLALAHTILNGLMVGVEGNGVLIVVDDAHLLDDLSAVIVHELVLQESAHVLATVRTGEGAPDAVTALWKNGLLRRMDLQALSRHESDRLLDAVLGGPVGQDCYDKMWALSRGNVLYLHHLVEYERESSRLTRVDGEWRWCGAPSVSPTLTALVELQIGTVADDVRDVVDLVAVAEPVDRRLLATLADSQSIETAEQLDLIAASEDSGAVYAGHPLYAEIRLRQCGPLRLKRLRGQLAAAMASAGNADPLRLGLLWLESDLAPNPTVFAAAAAIAASRLDLPLAERLTRAARDAHPDPTTTLQLAYILYLQEKGEAAEALLNSIDSDDSPSIGFLDVAILRAVNLMWPMRDPEKARAVLDDAIRLGDPNRNHVHHTVRAIERVSAAQPISALKIMSDVDYQKLDSFGRVLGYAAETIAYGDLGRVGKAGECARAGYRELIESPQESFHASGLAEFHAYALLAAGHVAEAASVAQDWYGNYATVPGMARAMALAMLGMTDIGRGDLAAARTHLDTAVGSFGDYGAISGLLYRFAVLHAELLARIGRIDAAAVALAAARRQRHPAYRYVESCFLLSEAWLSAVTGETAEACEFSLKAADFARDHGQLSREVLALQTAAQFGETGRAARLDELATQVEGPRAPLAARYTRALAVDDGDILDAVSQQFESIGDRLAAADCSAQASTAHRRAGSHGMALTAGARAVEIARACGGAVSPALAGVRMQLPLTAREREIATLLTRGLSNRDIAEAMSLSVRTVEGHIYQASTKTGVSSRAELSELARRLGGPAQA